MKQNIRVSKWLLIVLRKQNISFLLRIWNFLQIVLSSICSFALVFFRDACYLCLLWYLFKDYSPTSRSRCQWLWNCCRNTSSSHLRHIMLLPFPEYSYLFFAGMMPIDPQKSACWHHFLSKDFPSSRTRLHPPAGGNLIPFTSFMKIIMIFMFLSL